jgi:hypothetical protein
VAKAAVAILLCLCVGCFQSHPSSLDSILREYLRLAVALGERDPDALDFYYGPPDWVADIRGHLPTLPQIRSKALELTQSLEQLPLPEGQNGRRKFLAAQLRAIAARSDLLLGVSRSFDQEAELFFGIHLPPVALSDFAAVRTQLDRLLPGKDELSARYEAFDTKHMIPPDRVPLVMERAVQACRDQTLAHWKLPQGERVTLAFVHDKPWSAYSYYHGNYQSTIRINLDLGLTIDRALQLACHEGYPGHHVFNSLTEEQLARREKRMEFSVQPTFSPQSLLSEAAATAAPRVAFSWEERTRIEHDVLFPLAGLEAGNFERYLQVEELVDALYPAELAVAREYLDGRLEFVRAAAAMSDRALMAHSEAALRYLNEYRTYVVTYTEGRDRVEEWLKMASVQNSDREDRWTAYRKLIGTPDRLLDRESAH